MTWAAFVASVLLVVIATFQLGLALGAPWGRSAFGGQHDGVLPARLRIISGITGTLVYPLVIVLVLASAGFFGDGWAPGFAGPLMWVLVGLFALGTLVNAISRAKLERVWAPVSLVIAVCCGIIAAGM